MAGFEEHYGIIDGEAEVLEFVSTGEGGEDVFEFEIPEDTQVLLVMTEGEGGARLTLNGNEVSAISTNTTLSIAREGQLEVYLDSDPRPGTGVLTLWYSAGRSFIGRIVRITKKPGKWIKEKIKKHGRCWTCKQIIRSILKVIGGAVGIPDIPLLDDVVGEASGALEGLVGSPESLPRPLQDLLERFFGSTWPDIVREILRRIGQGPFGWVASSICTKLGYCP